MGIRIGVPIIKLSRNGDATKRKGNAAKVIKEAFSERYSKDQDLDRSLSGENVYYGFKRGKDLIEVWERDADAHRDSRGRKLRSDAVIGYTLIIKPDMESLSKMSESDRFFFLCECSKTMKELLGEHGLTVDAVALHKDELSDHLHVFGRDMEYKASKKINLNLYRDFNKEFPRRLREKGYDVEDMSVYDADKAKNMDEKELIEYKKSCREKKKSRSGRSSNKYKADKNRELDAKILEIEKQKAFLEESRKRIERDREEFEKDKAKLKEDKEELEKYKEKLEERSRHLEDRERSVGKIIDVRARLEALYNLYVSNINSGEHLKKLLQLQEKVKNVPPQYYQCIEGYMRFHEIGVKNYINDNKEVLIKEKQESDLYIKKANEIKRNLNNIDSEVLKVSYIPAKEKNDDEFSL